MRTLTRTLLIVALATINIESFAQIYGVKAGLNISNCFVITDGGRAYTKIIFRPNLGGTAEFKLGGAYSLETGLTFNNKGMKRPIDGGTDTIMRLGYLDIPVNVKYEFDLGENKLYLIVGSYIGFGIFGANIWKDNNGEKNFERIKWGNNGSDNELKRLDYGINLGAELEFKSIGVGVQYSRGLANYLPDAPEHSSRTNMLLSIYLAHKFGKK